MDVELSIPIEPQPDDVTCGPTCLHAVLNYYGDKVQLDEVINEIRTLDTGGTLAVFLANAALRRGFRATIYTYNLQVFDPSWFQVLQKLYNGSWAGLSQQLEIDTLELAELLINTIRDADETVISDRKYLSLFSFPDRRCEARELWHYLFESVSHVLNTRYSELINTVEFIISNGPLARRISRPMSRGVKRGKLYETYRVLTECLESDRLFEEI